MIFKQRWLYYLSIGITIAFLVVLIYLMYNAFFVVKNQFINIQGETYVNQVRKDDYTKQLSQRLTQSCSDDLCEVQSMLDFVTQIPYVVNPSVSRSPKNTVAQNFGDCDDKSNLLISLLHVRGFESYFVLVPKHIFVIVKLNDERIKRKKGLYINGEKYYILESTATNSKVGFNLKYKFDEINAIVDPFKNRKIKIETLEFKE